MANEIRTSNGLSGGNPWSKEGLEFSNLNATLKLLPPIGGIISWAKTFDAADSGTTDGTTSNKLVQSGQNFETTCLPNMIIHNTTDDTFAYITAVDSNTTLSISADIIVSGEDYVIYSTPNLPDGWVECNGSVLSDADSPYNGATLPDLNGVVQVKAIATATSDTTLTDSGIGWSVNEWVGFIVEITNGAGSGQSREIASNTADVLTFTDGGDWATAVGSTPNYIIRTSDRILLGSYKSGDSGLGGNAWHRITINEMPIHNHSITVLNVDGTGATVRQGAGSSSSASTENKGEDDIFDNRPPWYKIVWIMRVK